VLVIDNDAGARRGITSGLTREGYDVTACSDGISAIRELENANEKERPYTHIVTDIFMPDIDGIGMLKAIKIRRPGLPVLVIAEFGGEALKSTVLSERDTAYLDKPFEFSDLVKTLDNLSAGSTAVAVKADAVTDMREPAAAYLAIRITEPERSMEIFKELRGLEGVERCDAVLGDFDIIIVARGGSREEIGKLKERIGSLRDIEIVSAYDVAPLKLDREMDEFIRVYSQAVKARGAESLRQPGRISYIFVNVDKEAIQRVFMAVFLSDEIVFCDVIEDGAVLVAMIVWRGAVGVTPRIIEKLGRIDGALRVREAAVIRSDE
jgi:CheY-like chemotaxis protein